MYGNKLMPQSAINEVCTASREPLAADILRYGESLASRAQNLAERVDGKLMPVMTSAIPTPERCKDKEDREFPPLFRELRVHFDAVSRALESIEYSISRTEL